MKQKPSSRRKRCSTKSILRLPDLLIGGWPNATWQYLGLQRSTLKCVQDRDHTSESRALLDGPSNRIRVELLSYIRGSVANDDYVLFVHSGSH
jgi:hypothetical protein